MGIDVSNEGAMGSLIKGNFNFTVYPEVTRSAMALGAIENAYFVPGKFCNVSFGWSTYAANKCASSFGFRGSAYMDSIAYPSIFGYGTNDLRFFASTNGIATPSEIMRIVGSTGFVGIGETSPSAKLEIKGSGATSATTALRVENSNVSASLLVRDDGSSTLGFSYANTHIITGSVSINQSGSNIPLTVNGRNLTSDTGNKIFEVIGSAGTSVFSPRSNGLVYISTGQLYFEQNGLTSRYYDSRLELGTSVINTASTSANPQLYGGLRVFTWNGSTTNTEVFRIAGTGNVSLGFPSTFTNSAMLS